ncbi:MAG: S41 family peptidase [Bacteroidales bacterium]|jgi:carboxyl-terminal processing protease|nr:S41 family peptidase [Bacteroidales bacterium]HOL98793.1 S41 family peptidase [Bacteroidales bacterium]HOM37045.1 S41 family peptidase [Bacteroidales bacterium]HPD24670.1 S41 family peptidase [Bacteroidales bacterium]HRT00415.1 S41 family peptidase [Bacteroidales bacterium]
MLNNSIIRVLGLILGLLFLFSININSQINKPEYDYSFETVKHLDIFYSLYKELNLYYVDPIVPGEIIKTGIDAMLKSLDPYTVYIPETKIEEVRFMTTGQYGGIGALIQKRDEYTMISQPYENSPAQKSGLQAGDIILEIDSKSIKGLDTEEVSELLRGEPNTKVNIKIMPVGSKETKTIEIIREEIKLKSVPFYGMVEDGIGYINLNDFTNTAAKEVKDAYLELKKNNMLNTIILDLRGNPGGLLIEAVKICNLFIPKGETVVSTRGKVAQWDKEYKTTAEPLDTQIKVIVVVNNMSASASEIVAGCMQDLDRGVIVGQRTFGKGLVQTTRDISYNTILKVTTAKYYIPSGRCIQALDYSHRNPDGSVGHVPDSLIKEFRTKNGRKVYDGGGVNPDIVIEPEYFSNITSSLIQKNLPFDYAVNFKLKNPEIASPENFKITDEIYNDFVEWLQDKDFDYQTETEIKLNELIQKSKDEKYFDLAENEINILKQKFAHDKNKDLQLFKDEISEILAQEIIIKYYYQNGLIKYSLKNDPEIIKAVEIAKNDTEYKKILSVE